MGTTVKLIFFSCILVYVCVCVSSRCFPLYLFGETKHLVNTPTSDECGKQTMWNNGHSKLLCVQ